MSDHTRYQEDIGAYLLGALNDIERKAFERHIAGCSECQEELARAAAGGRRAAGLGGAVAGSAAAEGVADGGGRARGGPGRARPVAPAPAYRPLAIAAVLLIGLVVGFAVTQLGGEDETRTLAATVDRAMPQAGGSLRIAGDEATLRLHDMPDLGATRVYQVWLQHGDRLVPARTFEVGAGGAGRVELPDVRDADGVYVTREPRGGAQVPSENPIVSVPL